VIGFFSQPNHGNFAEGEVYIGECLPRRCRGKYSPIFTEPEENNCFSIITQVNVRETGKKNLYEFTGLQEKQRKVRMLELYSNHPV
jgi:hypothetical protein